MEYILETERLRLRKVIPEKDAAFFVEILNSPSFLKYVGDRKVRTIEDAIAYLENGVMKRYVENGHDGYMVELRETGESIGNCGLFKRAALDYPDIGFSFLPQHEGKGYGFESAQAVLGLARQLKIKRVLGITVAYNTRSIRLLESLGLRFEKTFHMEGDPEELSLYGMDL
jgi:[ribosomal protein S5]-alanine N-acetyltransferase